MTSTAADDPTPAVPAIRVHGSATPEEVAAVIAVLAAAASGGGSDGAVDGRRASGWASRRELLRGRHDPGPGAWRTATRP